MTREEAIRIFRKEIECLSHTKCEDCILEKACDPMTTTPFDSEYIEAYNMAIKALEQEPTTKNDLRVASELEKNSKKLEKDFGELDCISRADLIERINNAEEQFKYDNMETIGSDDGDPFVDGVLSGVWNIREMVKQAPSVTPQEPKTGHWEQYGNSWEDKFKCSECGKEQPKILCGERIIGHWSDYCPNCGCRMVEPQESEVEDGNDD